MYPFLFFGPVQKNRTTSVNIQDMGLGCVHRPSFIVTDIWLVHLFIDYFSDHLGVCLP